MFNAVPAWADALAINRNLKKLSSLQRRAVISDYGIQDRIVRSGRGLMPIRIRVRQLKRQHNGMPKGEVHELAIGQW